MIRVCLVEDQTLVREGLETLLGLTPDIRVIAQARTGREALALIPQVQPHVVLLDVRMPDGTGIDVLRELSSAGTLCPTIVLTTFDEDDVFLEVCRLGARGYLLKDVKLTDLASTIRAVAEGSTVFNPAMTERLLQLFQKPPTSDREISERLTQREIEVLHLMTGGFSNAEIALALHVAEGTVKNHVSSILSKMNVRDRVRAVLRGIELGYVRRP